MVTGVAAGSSVITVTATNGDESATATVTVTVPEETTGTPTTGSATVVWTWTVADYVKSTDATKFGAETVCGNVTAGKNVKERNSGNGISGTIAADVTGYFQLSNGADGSVFFTAPAGTKKIVVCAKLDSSSKQIALKTNAGSTTKTQEDLGSVKGNSGDDYKDLSFDVDITEDTVVYVGTFAASVTANLKAIQISK